MLRYIRSRVLPLATLMLPLAVLTACDSPTDDDAADIRGLWEAQDAGFTVYLDISSNELELYFGSHGICFEHTRYDIVHISGDTYALSLPGTVDGEEIIIRRSDNRLEIRDPGQSGSVVYYNQSTEDVSQLDICAGGGADPDIVCTDLPPVEVGASVTGSLSSTDPTTVYGTHYDLYRLDLTTARQVRVDLESVDFDSYLVIYDADGAYLADNDDAHDETVDASLTLDLAAGCYRIEATSFIGGETGSYTLSVN